MFTYKKIDWWVQVLLIAASFTICLIDPSYILYCYLSVGGWQLLSCLLHFVFHKKFISSTNRARYLLVVLVMVVTCVPTLFSGEQLVLVPAFLLLLVSPVLAFWYAAICKAEIRMMEHRLFIHLK